MMFRFCTAAPEAPLPRLSSLAISRACVSCVSVATYRSSRSVGAASTVISSSPGMWWAVAVGNAAFVMSAGAIWNGNRSYNGRRSYIEVTLLLAVVTGFAAGMTNSTKTVGGAIASAVFAVALASTGSIDDPAAGAAPLSGYLTVWAICAASAAVAAVVLVGVRPTSERQRPGTESVPGR